MRWEEHHKRRDTTARDRTAAIAKATEIVERLAVGSGAEFGNARGAELVAHFLDPMRRPTRVKEWSERMREEQERYCAKYVTPMIGDVRCRGLQRSDFQRILNQARTASVARQLRRTLTGVVNAGLIEGYLLPRQDVLRGVRWLPPDGTEIVIEPSNHSVTEDEIPTIEAVHALAAEWDAITCVVARTRGPSRRLLRYALGRALRTHRRTSRRRTAPSHRRPPSGRNAVDAAGVAPEGTTAPRHHVSRGHAGRR